MPKLLITLFGGIHAQLSDGSPLRLHSRNAHALLAYLAMAPGIPRPRETLTTLLWGETPAPQARNRLRQALYVLRTALGSLEAQLLRLYGDAVSLVPDEVQVDVQIFERLVAVGSPAALREAVGLYRGDLLQGLAPQTSAFEDWLAVERERLRELAIEALAKLLAAERQAGHRDSATVTATRLLALDPLQEVTHRTLMRLYLEADRRGAALRQYQTCVRVLQRELNIEPEEETRQLYQEILRHPGRLGPVSSKPEVGRDDVADVSDGLVGRADELTSLREILSRTSRGDGGVVLLVGEVGVGKTRLAQQLASEASVAGLGTLGGHCFDGEQMLPFGPWVDAFRKGGLNGTTPAIEELAPARRADLAWLLPELRSPTFDVEMNRPPEHQRLFASVWELLRALSSSRPLLIVLEDLHWADDVSLELLQFLARRLSGWPVLLVASAREEDVPEIPRLRRLLTALAGQPHVTVLRLEPLSKQSTAALVRALAPRGIEEPVLARLTERVWAIGEGNPFVTVETMRALEGDRQLADPRPLPLPQRVRELILERLERLGSAAGHLADAAATIGREFEFDLLVRAAEVPERDVAAGVEELVHARILHAVGERLDFTHARIREVAYGRLVVSRRRLLHGRVAAALEAVHGGDVAVHALALGLHWREAKIFDRAAHFLRQAGANALGRGALAEARDAYQCGYELLPYLEETPENLALGVDLRTDLYLPLVGLGELDRIVGLHEEADAIAVRLGDEPRRGRLAYRMANYAWLQAKYDEALTHGHRALAIAEQTRNPELRIIATHVLGMTLNARGEYPQAVEWLRGNTEGPDAELARRRIGFTIAPWVFACGLLAWALAQLGELDAAVDFGRRGMEEADRSGHRQGQAAARMYYALALVPRAELELARAVASKAVELADSESVLFWRAFAHSILGWIMARQGQPEEGLPLLAQGAAFQAEAGIKGTLASFWIRWAEGQLLAGQVAEAQRTGRRALELAQQAGERGAEAEALQLLAAVSARAGRVQIAQTYQAQAAALARELRMDPRRFPPVLASKI